MDRLISFYRTTSAIEPVVSLVIANLIPLLGVAFWGWDLWTILALYWAENGIIGIFNVAKILLAEGDPAPPVGTSDGSVRPLLGCGRFAMAGFFLVHYGIFWLGHGVFVLFVLPAFGGTTVPFDGVPADMNLVPFGGIATNTSLGPFGGVAADMHLVLYGTVGLVISHGISFWFNYIGRGEYRRASAARLMAAPYARVVVLHVTIILGAFVSMFLGSPVGALVVLVLLKTGLDLALHRREHVGLADPAS